MRKIIYSMLASMMLFVGCTVEKQPYHVDLIVKSTESDFWKSVQEGAKDAANLYEIELSLYGPKTEEDYAKQVHYVEQSIKKEPNAILLAAGEYIVLEDIVQEAIDDKIPVIMIDSDIRNEGTIAYIGTDNKKIGEMLAEEMLSHMPHNGEVAIISFLENSDSAKMREDGLRAVLEGVEGIRILETRYCFSSVEEAERLTKQLIEDYPELVAIAGLNKESAEGAAEAVRKSDTSQLQVYAIDCSPKEATYMEEGVIALALVQNPYQMGYYAVESAYKHLEGEEIEDIYTEIYTVDIDVLFTEMYQQLIFPFEE